MAGILYPEEEISGALSPATMNPLLYRQVERARAANPRPDPMPNVARSWSQYPLSGLAKQFPGPAQGATGDDVRKAMWDVGLSFGVLGMTKPVAGAASMVKKVPDDYRGSHRSPDSESGAPLHDLTGGGRIYPDDVYGPRGAQYYGHYGQNHPLDIETYKILQTFKGKPESTVTVYRAVPKDAPDVINKGDWVTVNQNYAKTHGEGPLQGDYKIVSKKVRADEIYTNGDSFHEWGYHPKE